MGWTFHLCVTSAFDLPGTNSHSSLISILETVIDSRLVHFLSVPITSGRRLWSLASRFSIKDIERVNTLLPEQFDVNVLRPNVLEAKSLADKLRKRLSPAFVLNPSCLHMHKWSENNYREFWKTVIRSSVCQVFVAPGWQYSHGCLEECTEAIVHNVPVFSLDGVRMNAKTARTLIHGALREGELAGFSLPFLRDALAVLESSPSTQVGSLPKAG